MPHYRTATHPKLIFSKNSVRSMGGSPAKEGAGPRAGEALGGGHVHMLPGACLSDLRLTGAGGQYGNRCVQIR